MVAQQQRNAVCLQRLTPCGSLCLACVEQMANLTGSQFFGAHLQDDIGKELAPPQRSTRYQHAGVAGLEVIHVASFHIASCITCGAHGAVALHAEEVGTLLTLDFADAQTVVGIYPVGGRPSHVTATAIVARFHLA